jgi:hypothetical protein
LFIVLRLCRPTSRIHSWGLQHTPARTYCSPSSCMRSKSQLRLPCQPISIILLAISSSFIRLLIDEHLQLQCRLLVLYCSQLAVLSLCCSLVSSYDFHVVLYLYSGIRCHSHLAALQADFKDPFLEPLTHFCKNILLAFQLYEIKISVTASVSAYRDSHLCGNLIDYTAQHRVVATSMST